VQRVGEYDKILGKWLAAVGGTSEADAKASADKPTFRKLVDANISDEDVSTLFSLYDTNKDHSVSWKEYVLMAASIHKGTAKMPLLESAHTIKLNPQDLQDIQKDWLRVIGGGKTDVRGTSVGYSKFRLLMQTLPEKDLKVSS